MSRLAASILGPRALALGLAALAGCTNLPVRIGYETYGHVTTSTGERLYRVDATRVGALYLKPGIDFARYATVVFRAATLAYGSPPGNPAVFHREPGNYRLRLDAADRLRRELGDALAHELVRDRRFRVVPEPTADTLMISPHIVGLRWETPPEKGGESLFVRKTGLMTLVLDLRDGRTGALLARLADASVIKPADVGLSGAYESSPANNWAGVRDVCARWGWILRGTLKALHELPPMPDP